MTFPPPPPDRMHLQYQPVPVPQQQPQQMGPGGAYGPMQYAPDQPVPGQVPHPSMTMAKPGTITGVQVILWIFLALSSLGNLASIISMVGYFSPFQLIGLAFAAYSTVQALLSGVHITRGKRWAWIWSLVSAIIGLVMSAAAIVFGILMFDNGGWVTLLIGAALAGTYGTLLGLLCSKSARQWILMHRIQRGEVQLPGAMGPGGTVAGGMIAGGAAQAPQRPENRPGSVTFAVVLHVLLMALAAWTVYSAVTVMSQASNGTMPFDSPAAWYGTRIPLMAGLCSFAVLVCALFSMIGLLRGKFGARVFAIVWTSVLVLAAGFFASFQLLDYFRWGVDMPPQVKSAWTVILVRDVAVVVLIIAVFIAVLLPGVRAWTPGRPATALVVMVPMGQQAGPYGPPQQGGYPAQPQGPQQPQPPYGGR